MKTLCREAEGNLGVCEGRLLIAYPESNTQATKSWLRLTKGRFGTGRVYKTLRSRSSVRSIRPGCAGRWGDLAPGPSPDYQLLYLRSLCLSVDCGEPFILSAFQNYLYEGVPHKAEQFYAVR